MHTNTQAVDYEFSSLLETLICFFCFFFGICGLIIQPGIAVLVKPPPVEQYTACSELTETMNFAHQFFFSTPAFCIVTRCFVRILDVHALSVHMA